MKLWKVAATFIFVFLFSLLELTSANSGNPPLGQTNAPGEQNCTVCHNSFGLNSGSGQIQLLNVPIEYKPGQTYSIMVAIQDPNGSRWGFELTAINDKGEQAGTIIVTDSTNTELRSATVGGGPRNYLVTTIAGNFSGLQNAASWQFDWMAPAQNSGSITFYTTGVAADRDGTPAGDRVYSTAATVRMFEQKPPTLNFITPTHGPIEGNTRVTLRGENFQPGVSVTFDGADAQGQFIDETTLSAIAPPHAAGTVDIRIANTNGMSVTVPQVYTYDPPPPPPPQLLFASPDHGPTTGGLTVKLSGLNFLQGTRVIWDGRELPTTYVDINFISVTTPLHNPGPISVAVINPDGSSAVLKAAFTYEGPVPAPVIKLLSPLGGEVFSAGGAPATITWTIDSNGTPSQRLLLSTDGGNSFSIVVATGLNATVTHFNWAVPEELTSDRARLRLEVVQPEATVRDESKKDFKIVSAPALDRVSPATTKAGTTRLDLDLSGDGFAKGATVEMDGVKLKATVISPTSINVKKVPHNVPGSHFILVRNPNGGASVSFLFTVAQ